MEQMITQETFNERYNHLTRLVNGIRSRWSEINRILIDKGGLTKEGADLDRTLLQGHLYACNAEKYRLMGNNLREGEMAASIPYDVPNFLVLQYTGVPYLAGMDVTLHFAEVVKDVGRVWQEVIDSLEIPGYKVDNEMSGREFGELVMKDNEYRHFVIAGGADLVEEYKNADMAYMDTLTVFGPTRPKTLILQDVPLDDGDPTIENIVNTTVFTALFDSGQLCALDKELIVVASKFDKVRDLAVRQMRRIAQEAQTTHYVAPLKDKGAFVRAKRLLNMIKSDSNYDILVGGNIDEETQFIPPTLIEAKKSVHPEIDGFWPYLILNKAANDNDAVKRATSDSIHGCYAYVYTTDTNRFYLIEKYLLGGHYGTVLKNGNILNHSIGQPYGAFKESFFTRQRLVNGRSGGIVYSTGPHFLANIVTYK